jgi:hypothetical protein
VILKSQDPVTPFREINRSLGIIFNLVEVLAAVHLDDQFFARGAEIGDIGVDGMLPPKLSLTHQIAAQPPH